MTPVTRTRGFTPAVALGVFILLAAVVGVRGVRDPAQAVTAVTLADLAQRREQVVAILNQAQTEGTTGFAVGIEPSRQRIGVFLFTTDATPPPDLASLQSSLGSDVGIQTIAGTPHLQGQTWAGEPLSVTIGARAATCTIGFGVGTKDGRQGFLTAGHCFDTTKPADQQHARTVDDQLMTGLDYNYGPSDWGVFILDNAEDEAMGEVTTLDGGNPVRAVVAPTLDMPICKTGRTTETTCGKITLVDTTVSSDPIRNEQGAIVTPSVVLRGMIMNDLCSESGDSGGPVYTDPGRTPDEPVDAVGLINGGLTQLDASGRAVCLEKLNGPGTSVGFASPLAATPAATTETSSTVYIKTSTGG